MIIFAEMIRNITLRVSPEVAATDRLLRDELLRNKELKGEKINDYKIIRRSIDARKRNVVVQLTLRVATDEDVTALPPQQEIIYQNVDEKSPVIVIVGAGPAGLFAALKALEKGIRPIVLERGKDVDSRRLDIAKINRTAQIVEESNYCFGEGGAGTFSDGKLFTRSKKRGNVEEVLQTLYRHGASEEILADHHPHIGSDRLPGVIKNIRETIISHGGEVHFNTKADRILIENGKAYGVATSDGKEYHGAVVLATGHSARDTLKALHDQQIRMEAKGIAMGVRLEHPQKKIDCLQYHSPEGRGKWLPAAEYSFVTQVDGRGVYSFCMCPGGVIVPAASADKENIVNGMSASGRAGRMANAAMVVEIRPEDFPEYSSYGALSLLMMQEDLERKFYESSGGTLHAPAQRMKDFTEGKKSESLNASSYIPGLYSADFRTLLPEHISGRLEKGFREFDRKCRGFLTNEAQMIGLESRTSCPVRLPRDKETLCHTEIEDLYPAGEGAGYAGGIVSAAIDGMRCVEAYYNKIQHSSGKVEV